VDVFKVRSDGGEELLASGLGSEETAALREWFCYTKPLGQGIKIEARAVPDLDSGFSVVTAGHQPDAAEMCSGDLKFTRGLL
jgi:hypothetical protein